jgi:hypothetical protein
METNAEPTDTQRDWFSAANEICSEGRPIYSLLRVYCLCGISDFQGF